MGKKGGCESDYEEGNGSVWNQSLVCEVNDKEVLVTSRLWGSEKAKCQESKWKEEETCVYIHVTVDL